VDRFLTLKKHSISQGLVSITAILSLLLIGCGASRLEPVALMPEDMCAYCKMAISEKQYAAELIDGEGQVFKFDDLGCMAKFVKSNKDQAKPGAYFVMDFESRQWTKAADAYYVRSPELTTPMRGGMIAFKDESKARDAVARFHGQQLSFKDVLGE
jgi:copper chaperone NosL